MLRTVVCSGVPRADEAFARSRIDAMSRCLAAQGTLSVTFDSSLDVVAADDRKLTIAGSGGVALHGPDTLRVIRQGGSASVEAACDGKVRGVLNRDVQAFPGGPSGHD